MTDSVGARLRQGRELRGLTLQQASESTKVRAYYLQALENDDYSAIPSGAQARGFLHIYAEFLELDPGSLVPPVPLVAPAPSVDASPTPEVVDSRAGRTTLWGRLLGRLARQPNKQAPPPPSTHGTMPAATTDQAGQAAAVPAEVDAKTVRHRKETAAGATGGASATADVKKNAGR